MVSSILPATPTNQQSGKKLAAGKLRQLEIGLGNIRKEKHGSRVGKITIYLLSYLPAFLLVVSRYVT